MEMNRARPRSSAVLLLLSLAMVASGVPKAHSQQEPSGEKPTARRDPPPKAPGSHFETSDRCIACHNGLSTSTGEDVSIGVAWRTSMMANSARDPYWIAGVRREILDHPSAAAAIEDECTICHMPMMRYEEKLAGRKGEAFVHFPPNHGRRTDRLAEDGVSCSVCHQITAEKLGTRESFVGGFKVDETSGPDQRQEYGPYDVDKGQVTIMRSSSRFEPARGEKVMRSSELCATCHTLVTRALNEQGQEMGELPEQVPYQEWLHSRYKDSRSCQSCHMPVVEEEVPIASVLGKPRPGSRRHTFVGGNFFMQRLLHRHRNDLGIAALPEDLGEAATHTVAHLQSEAARITIGRAEIRGGRVEFEIAVENRSGHKLPTAYPSRRLWLHATVRDRDGKVLFESGAFRPDGSIVGNDNDEDAARFEPHYEEITRPDEVQIYEAILHDPASRVTTGLLTAVGFLKDNRLLPHGFDKSTAEAFVAVHGPAEADPDFAGGGDTTRYSVDIGRGQGPFQVDAELWYQPIAFRWAMNLRPYEAAEPARFVRYFEDMAAGSGVVLARGGAVVE
jgi:hypothetical protein